MRKQKRAASYQGKSKDGTKIVTVYRMGFLWMLAVEQNSVLKGWFKWPEVPFASKEDCIANALLIVPEVTEVNNNGS